MEKVYRSGVAIDVALRAAARRNTNQGRPAQPPAAFSMQGNDVDPVAAAPATATPPAPTGLRVQVKRTLRATVKLAWRVVRPFVRPMVFRTRRYMAFELQQSLQNYHASTALTIERVAADLMREIQVSRELLRTELAGAKQHSGEQLMRRVDLMERQTLTRIDRLALAQEDAYSTLAAKSASGLSRLEKNVETLGAAIGSMSAQTAALANTLPPRLDLIEQYGHATARRVIVPCGPDEVLLKTEAGYVMCPASELSIIACLADTGDLERGTRLLIQRALRPGDVFVDVGANLGIHALAAASALMGEGKIIAFEPFETTRRMLEQTIRINGYAPITEIHQAAVSDRAGRQALYLGKSSGHHSLYELDAEDASSHSTDETSVEVATVRLDDVIGPGRLVSMIKIDAEGAELAVLDSASATIAANPDIALIVEFGPSHLARNGQNGSDWLGRFTAMGLIYRAIDPASGALETWNMARLEACDSINLLFARPGAPVWNRLGPA